MASTSSHIIQSWYNRCNILSCTSWCYTARMRHVTATILFLGTITSYSQRVGLHVAIVEMVITKEPEYVKPCDYPEGQSAHIIEDIHGGKHNWNEKTQAMILGAFYIGYLLLNVPMGYVCDKFGARIPFLLCCIVSTVLTLLTPLCINNFHWIFFMILRIVMGGAQGIEYAGVTSLISRWVSPDERATIGGVVYSSINMGVIMGMMVTGLIITHFKSWPAVFYTWGSIGALHAVSVAMYVYSGPEEHPHITSYEYNFITVALPRRQPTPVPMKKILCDRAVWALIFGQMGQSYITFTLILDLPKYLNNVLRFDMKRNAFASSLPFLMPFVSTVLTGKMADYLIRKKNANVGMMRIAYTAFANIGAAGCLLVVGYVGCNFAWAMVFITLALFCSGVFYTGLKINVMDITINHTGMVMGIITLAGTFCGIVAPIAVGYIVQENKIEEWRMVFWVNSIVAVVTYVLYMFLCSGKRRLWDLRKEEMDTLPIDTPKVKWFLEK